MCFCDQDGRPSEELCFDIEVLRIFQVEILDRSSPIFKPVSSKDVLIFRFCSLNKIYSKQREQWKIDHERRCFSTEKEDPVTASDPAIQPLMSSGWWLYTWRSSAPSGAAVSTKPTYSDLCVSSLKKWGAPRGLAYGKYHGEFWVSEARTRLWCSPVSFFLSFEHQKSWQGVRFVVERLYSYIGYIKRFGFVWISYVSRSPPWGIHGITKSHDLKASRTEIEILDFKEVPLRARQSQM